MKCNLFMKNEVLEIDCGRCYCPKYEEYEKFEVDMLRYGFSASLLDAYSDYHRASITLKNNSYNFLVNQDVSSENRRNYTKKYYHYKIMLLNDEQKIVKAIEIIHDKFKSPQLKEIEVNSLDIEIDEVGINSLKNQLNEVTSKLCVIEKLALSFN
ncbi:MAG: hypothetical protein IJ086_00655 [Clostridium sp.]|nr:hypothetical protein [Clostridium sp.]